MTFSIAAMQTNVVPFYTDASYEPKPENLERTLDRAAEAVRFLGRSGPRLFSFAEFGFTGSPAGSPARTYIGQAVRIPGPETAVLAAVARLRRIYLSAQFYEVDDAWPGRFFNTSFIIGPDGDIILKYRKHYDNTCKTKPGDVWDRYVEINGEAALFPVVETEIGRLGVFCAYEVNFPEVTRCLALQGAEILIHHTSEPNAPDKLHGLGGWDLARRVRAYENIAYVSSPNEGWFLDSARANESMRGRSQIIDFDGQIIGIVEAGGESYITADVDLEALRQRRTRVGMNFLAQTQTAIYARVLAQHRDGLFPANAWLDEPVDKVSQNNALTQAAIARMQASGVYRSPARTVDANLGERWL